MNLPRLCPTVLAGLLCTSCIARSPDPSTPDDQGASGTAAASTLPTAKYGEVPGTPLLGKAGIGAFEVHGEKEKVRVSTVPVQGQPFSQAIHAEILESSSTEWSVQLQAPTAASVQSGDAMLATFYVRATELQEAGYAESQFVFELAKEPYTKSVTYSFGVTPEWRKVHVRFESRESYAPGEAQMIFRLGYDPQTIEIGGVVVESFGKQIALAMLPTTAGIDRKYEPKPVQAKLLPPVAGGELRFEVNPSEVIGSISPYVYGINSQHYEGLNVTVRRMGGNRQTVYNWELNASNAGNDWQHVNDDWPCTVLGYKDCDRPGAQMVDFVVENQRAGIQSLLTIPMLDYVSADKRGSVPKEEQAPSRRFVRSYPRKKAAYSLTPDLKDGAVYQDELVHMLVQKFGPAKAGGVRFYALDNEPALWPSTHPRVHPKKTSYVEVVTRTEATASAITEVDPTATILGGVMFGWGEFTSLSSAPDAEQHNAKYGSYVDYYLASMQRLEQKHKRRLVHVLDVHWYPEVRGAKRITQDDASRKTIDARLAAPRSLWDPTFRERSWVADQLDGPIRLFPWLKEKTAKHYPGTKLAMTEYNYGGGKHVSGGLAQVDVLGIFGREGLLLANYWGKGAGVGKMPGYIEAAFRLYRNYDGKKGSFGDTAVAATVEDLAKASVYAATDSRRRGTLTVIVINKDQRRIFNGRFKIGGATKYVRAQPYGFGPKSAEIRRLPSARITGNELRYDLQPLSATVFVCTTR